jgi:hypothetical protein
MHNEGRNVNPIFEAGLKKLNGYYNLTTDVPAYRFATSEWLYYSAIVTGIPARTRGVENEPKNVQIGPEMKEIWSIYCFDHTSFISGPIWTFLGSFSTPRVRAGIPVTIAEYYL